MADDVNVDLSRVDVEHFLESLQVENVVRSSDDHFKFSCPFPGHQHGDATPSAYMNTGELEPDKATHFKCFGCGTYGTAIKFLSLHEEVTIDQAKIWLRDAYDSTFREPVKGSYTQEWDDWYAAREAEQPEKSNPVLAENLCDDMLVDWRKAEADYLLWKNEGHELANSELLGYMFERGFLAEDLDDWEIGYDPISDRIAIPVRNEMGGLIGFKGRDWTGAKEPKYLILGDRYGDDYGFKPYEAKQVLFGLDRAKRHDEIIVVEGELNTISMHAKGWTNTVGLGGSSMLSNAQITLLRRYADTAIIFYDSLRYRKEGEIGPALTPDRAGLEATAHAIERLEMGMRVRVVDYHAGDPAEMGPEEIRVLVDGAVSSLEIHD